MIKKRAISGFAKSWVLLLAVLAGCSARPEFAPQKPDSADYAPPVLDYSLPEATDGSLYRHQYTMTLFQDRRAYRVGDILTVMLTEETESSKKADTSYNKNAGVGFVAPVFGSNSIDAAVNIDADRNFDGSASSSQGNKLQGAITVTVHEVLPNDVLRISGEKWLRLNQGDEFIRLTGIVRVDDINRSNQISSLRIGDARITYAGRGALADSNASGWLTQFFNSPWMPF
ncbi:flagellar basal body L-ring protein FlgH [Enterovibrio nigricans]|nr:flagellar basal body L-ring protein FlgH [Enterovibrio nigricans]